MTYRLILFTCIIGALGLSGCHGKKLEANWDSDSNVVIKSDSGTDSMNTHVDTDTAETGMDSATETDEVGVLVWDSDFVCAGEPGSNCDGAHTACWSGCWGCAYEGECQNQVAACEADEWCNQYLICRNEICCGDAEIGECSLQPGFDDCMRECRDQYDISGAAVELYREIEECIGCRACSCSCGERNATRFGFCDSWVEEPLSAFSCYEEDAVIDWQTSCVFWAGLGGPCSAVNEDCSDDTDCAGLRECVMGVHLSDSPGTALEECMASYPGGMALYQTVHECIYCEACDWECMGTAEVAYCAVLLGK